MTKTKVQFDVSSIDAVDGVGDFRGPLLDFLNSTAEVASGHVIDDGRGGTWIFARIPVEADGIKRWKDFHFRKVGDSFALHFAGVEWSHDSAKKAKDER